MRYNLFWSCIRIMKFHHIGIVVPRIQDSIGELTKFLNFDTIGIPTLVGSQKVNVCFLNMGSLRLELIEPVEESSPISDFVSDGGGFHHICFEVDDIHKEIEKMVKNGARLLVEPVKGFDDRIITFLLLHMKKTNCNLIELVEIKK